MGTKPVLTIGDKTFTQKDFAAYVKANQTPIEKGSTQVIVQNMFKSWSDDKCMAYEENMLENKYEDFNNVYKEYHDGILLFDLTDKKVWSKAVSDTAGLEKFYESNKGKYMWKERVHYQTFTCLNASAKADAIKMLQKGKSIDEIQAKLNKKVAGTVSFRDTKSEKTDATAEKLWDKKGLVDIPKEGENDKFYWVIGNLSAESKTLKEAKGIATSDYQNYLEKEWIKELRAKYPVQVNEETIRGLYAN
jgi:peptidyl-prolyl cis-trans isomerase SurA